MTAGPSWDEAFLRVESYLRAHHIESRVLLNRHATRIIAKARLLAASQPGQDAVTLAMQVTHAQLGEWFTRVCGEGDWNDERFRARGRLAMLLADVPGKWPDHFLSDEPLPDELVTAMRTSAFQAGPEVRFSHMPPTRYAEIIRDETDPPPKAGGHRNFLRAAYPWLVFIGLLGFAWFWSH